MVVLKRPKKPPDILLRFLCIMSIQVLSSVGLPFAWLWILLVVLLQGCLWSVVSWCHYSWMSIFDDDAPLRLVGYMLLSFIYFLKYNFYNFLQNCFTSCIHILSVRHTMLRLQRVCARTEVSTLDRVFHNHSDHFDDLSNENNMSDEDMVFQDHRDNATDGLSDNLLHWKQLMTVSDSMFCQPVGVFSSRQCGYQTSPQHGHSPITSALSAIPGLGNQICTLILDTGASKCSTGNRNDFVDYQAFDDHNKKTLDGIAAGLQIEGFGTVEYVITADDNSQITLSIQAYYVPGLADTRLVSPQGLVTSDDL